MGRLHDSKIAHGDYEPGTERSAAVPAAARAMCQDSQTFQQLGLRHASRPETAALRIFESGHIFLAFSAPNHFIVGMKNLALLFAFAFCVSALPVSAAPQNFDFKDPKGVNNVVFRTDAPLESINGTATGVSGSVTFDPENPGATKGKIVVEAASMHVPNSTMQGHLQSDQWLDVAKHPQITFEVISLDNVKTDGNKTTADVTGTMTIKGASKQIVVPVKMTYLKDKLHDRLPSLQGDLLVLRANFSVKRSDFGINKGVLEEKVSDDIELTLSVAGQSPR